MVLILYSDKNCEHQAIYCLKSLTNKLTPDVKIVYYTLGFKSDFVFKGLRKIQINYNPIYPRFHFYKAELSLYTLDIFPDEEHFAFTDTDVIFSSNFSFDKIKHNNHYPLASFGPFEYPFMWIENTDGSKTIYNERALMDYCNVKERTQRYVWSCFYSFNRNCRDFLEEYTSFCKNKYLLDRQFVYYPYADETAFNVCLWKRDAVNNLGFAFVNTHLIDTVKQVEEHGAKDKFIGNSVDVFGTDWEYIHDSKSVLLYHGFKEEAGMKETVDYLLQRQKEL